MRPTTSSFSDVWDKLCRAKYHAAELQDCLDADLAPGRQRFEVRFDDNVSKHALYVSGLPQSQLQWQLLLGDITHNLRASLDYLAWKTVELDGGVPDHSTSFPIHETGLDANCDKVGLSIGPGKRSKKVRKLLEQVQPFYESLDGPHSALWLVHELNIIDKHRLPLVCAVGVSVVGTHFGYDNLEDSPGIDLEMLMRPAREHEPMTFFDFRGGAVPEGFQPKIALQAALNESAFPDLQHQPLMSVVERMIVSVEYVLRRFDHHYGGPDLIDDPLAPPIDPYH